MRKEGLDDFKKNMGEVLDIQLALEGYQLNTAIEVPWISEAYKAIGDLRRKRDDLTEEERIKESEDLLKKLHSVLDKIGKEKFIFYDDGGIGYKWDNTIKGGKYDRRQG